MRPSSININKSIQAISRYLVHQLSQKDNCSEEEALKKLLKTMTYELLQDKDSELFAESPEYLWSLLKDEEAGDMEHWAKL